MSVGILLSNENRVTGSDIFLQAKTLASLLQVVSPVSATTRKSVNSQVKTFKSVTDFEENRMQELERLATFFTWPESNTSSPLSLARSGFAYSGEGNKVFCPLCQIKLDNLTRDDNPAEEHRKRSPGCHFANQIATFDSSSEPIAPSSLEATSGRNSALWDVYTSASRRFHSQNRQEDPVPNASSPNAHPLSLTVRVDRTNPDYELLRRERIRLDTFYDWPTSAHAVPEALARDGFFYTGSTDRVRCAFCHNTLHTWAPGDSPMEEHRKHFPRCPFVLDHDVGNVGINNDVRVENSGQNLLSLTGGVMTGASAGQTSVELPSVEASMSTPAVRAALEMGFLEENVKQVVQQCLTETGQLFPSAELLVEQLLSLGISQSYLPIVSSSAETNSASASNAASASSASASSSANLAFPPPCAPSSSANLAFPPPCAPSSSANLAFPPPCAPSSSAKLAFPTVTSSHDVPLSSATVASPTFLGATSSLPAAATAVASSSSSIAAAQTAASASFGGETEQRTGEGERSEETTIPQNEGAKKGNGSTTKRKRGSRKAKTGASVAGSSSSQAGSCEPQAVASETSSGSIAAAGNSSAEENAGLVVDPEEQELLDENSRLKEARTCKVCMDKEVNTVFLPCGHLICCDTCSPKIRNCPLCRTFIRGTVKTYLS